MGQFIQESDLAPFADIDTVKATAMIEDAEADAILIAPCIPGLLIAPDGETDEQRAVREAKLAGIKSTLRAAILRWQEAGTGAIQTTISGPFSETQQHQARRSMFWPTEIEKLQGICKPDEGGMVSVAISSGRSGRYRTVL